MYRIAITGKANAGKNTVGKLLIKGLEDQTVSCMNIDGPAYGLDGVYFIAFADPIKKMARLAFPQIPRRWLYGSSKFRNNIIPGAFKGDKPLTVRQLLIDLGNDFGRKYDPMLWIKNLGITIKKLEKKEPGAIVVTDCRFRDEFEQLKAWGFFQIRILRDAHTKIDDVSETNQDGILDSEFDFVINNNGTKNQLKAQIEQLITKIRVK